MISILKETGCWTFIRQRPVSKIANPEDNPKAIFISGFNSAPHSLDYETILNENSIDVDIKNNMNFFIYILLLKKLS